MNWTLFIVDCDTSVKIWHFIFRMWDCLLMWHRSRRQWIYLFFCRAVTGASWILSLHLGSKPDKCIQDVPDLNRTQERNKNRRGIPCPCPQPQLEYWGSWQRVRDGVQPKPKRFARLFSFKHAHWLTLRLLTIFSFINIFKFCFQEKIVAQILFS